MNVVSELWDLMLRQVAISFSHSSLFSLRSHRKRREKKKTRMNKSELQTNEKSSGTLKDENCLRSIWMLAVMNEFQRHRKSNDGNSLIRRARFLWKLHLVFYFPSHALHLRASTLLATSSYIVLVAIENNKKLLLAIKHEKWNEVCRKCWDSHGSVPKWRSFDWWQLSVSNRNSSNFIKQD